jgi:2-polyprenyl-3-methyl-5-hydroxy-6-metoxy-1,4-benzoquinol methylase
MSFEKIKNYFKYQLIGHINRLNNKKVTYKQWATWQKNNPHKLDNYVKSTNFAKEQTAQWLMCEPFSQSAFRLLDVGCGPGLMRDLIDRFPKLSQNVIYTGVDQSETAIAFARERFASRGEFFIKDALHDELPAGPFDVILINAVVEHIPGFEELVEKCLNLRPKVFVLTTFAVTNLVKKDRILWNGDAGCFMNTYPFGGVHDFLRRKIEGPIFTAYFGPSSYNPDDYWFPYRGGVLYYCRPVDWTSNLIEITN